MSAKIFVSYTSRDREWAYWIGVTLREKGFIPLVHEWEVGAGESIARWMDESIAAADRMLGVFTDAYCNALYSSSERWAAYWDDPGGRTGFLIPIEVEHVTNWPPLTRPLKRLSLVGLSEAEAERKLLAFLRPPGPPDIRPRFPPSSTASRESVTVDIEAMNTADSGAETLPARRPAWPALAQLGDRKPESWAQKRSVSSEGQYKRNNDHLVILVHGINTQGNWMDIVKPVLEDSGFVVGQTGYGEFSVLRFLSPITRARRIALNRVIRQIQHARAIYKERRKRDPREMSVISHSFGTYIVSKILVKHPEFQWRRVIFAGSVVPDDFDLETASEQFTGPLLNHVGTSDYWPALAKSTGWGYGAIGSIGWHRPGVETRWHLRYRHSDFLTKRICKDFWIPFLESGDDGKPREADSPDVLPWWVRVLSRLPLRIANKGVVDRDIRRPVTKGD